MFRVKYGLSEACYQFFSTLSTPSRLGILELLREAPKNVTELAEALNQEQSMISHNLKPLLDCNFIKSSRDGKKRVYSLNKETIKSLFKIVKNHEKKYCPKGGKCDIKGD